jgi:PAS domain S-box-containing protein
MKKNGKAKEKQTDNTGTTGQHFSQLATLTTGYEPSRLALPQSEQVFMSIYEESPIAIQLCDSDGRVVAMNNACLRMFGLSAFEQDEWPAIFADARVPYEAKKRLRKGQLARYQMAFDFGKARKLGTYRGARSDIADLWVMISPVGARERKSSSGYLVQIQEITERERAKKALQKSEELFRGVYEESPIAIALADASGRVLGVNSACADLFGPFKSKDSASPKLFDDPYTPHDAKERLLRGETVTFVLAINDEVRRYRAYRRTKPGVTHIWVMISPLGLRAGQPLSGYVVHVLDITELEQAKELLRHLPRRLVEVQEAERRRIARELHDEVAQSLTALKLLIGMISRKSIPEATPYLDEAAALTNDLMTQVSDLALTVRPPMLDDLGLLPALLWHFNRYTAQTSVHVILKHKRLEGRFAPEVETAAYRIVQEALTNVARHAKVQKVKVQLHASEKKLTLRIQDNGVGFEPGAALAAMSSYGLVNMRERAISIGGQLIVDSAPGHGTCLTAELPLPSPGGW